MADNNQATIIIDGKVVPRKSEGTVFGSATLNDRIRDDTGKLTQDTIPLTYGGLITLPAGSDTVAGVDLIDVTSVSLDKEKISVAVGANAAALVATVLPADATDKKVTYKSSNVAIATVTQAGVVKGIAPGVTTVIATAGDQTDSVEVTVTAP